MIVEDTIAMFSEMSAVTGVSAMRSNGAIKHYNIQVSAIDIKKDRLISLWPFCTVAVDSNGIHVDYLVRPEEVKEFYNKLSNVLAKKEKQVAVILQFICPITESMKRQVARYIRGSDRIVWFENRAAIILDNFTEEAVKAVQHRIKSVLAEEYKFSLSVQQVV